MAINQAAGPRRPNADRRASGVRRARARTDQAVVIADAMTPFCGAGAVVFTVAALTQFAVDGRPGAWVPSTLAALTATVLAGGFVLLRAGRGEALRRRPVMFGVTVGALVGLNPLVYILATQVTYPAIGMLLVIVGVGGLLHDWRRAVGVILALDLAWVACACAFGAPVTAATFLAQLVKANALAMVLNIARTRTARRLEQARLEIQRMATTDELTGLSNQRGLLEAARELPTRLPAGSELTVVYVDIDGLKSVNDAHGHAAGDRLIRSVADVLRRAFRVEDTMARVGGDEFVALLVTNDHGVAPSLVARVHQYLAEAGISASVGTARATGGSSAADLDALLKRADAAMYAVKTARKNGRP